MAATMARRAARMAIQRSRSVILLAPQFCYSPVSDPQSCRGFLVSQVELIAGVRVVPRYGEKWGGVIRAIGPGELGLGAVGLAEPASFIHWGRSVFF